MSLERLLHPLSPPRFFDEHWEKKPLVIKGVPGRFSDLFSSRDVGRLLAYRPPRSIDGLLLIKEGRHRNENWMTPDGLPRIDKVRAAWREGYTLVINRMEHVWEPIGRFGSTLEEQLHHPVGINLYITPARAQGFHAHFDVMDGFILQLEGSKVWQVRGPQVELPMSDEHTSTPPDNLPPLLLEQKLESGDILYIPRGFVHEAKTADTASVHLTVGIQPVTWSNLFEAALSAVRSDRRLRQALPPRFLDGQPGMAELFQALLVELPRSLELGGALAQLAERLIVQKPPPPLEELLVDTVEPGNDAILGRREGMVFRVLEGPGYAALQYSGGKLVGPAKIGPALRHVTQNTLVPVRSLPGLSQKEQCVLAGRLVRNGILIVQEAP
ncbi:cupin [Cystobacter fuscus]|uniref:cupin domain-containing protein n=1 Tax=Cystobacter fuscus TaxID=43 RepID=UPI002B2A88C3|nr:cupin [Cystobacter fuscus]